MNEVTLFRLYLLRGMYLLMFVGLVFTIWPQLLHHPVMWPMWHAVGCSLLGAISLLALLGIRYPLKMLPVLFLELIWKIIYLIAVALPLWSSGQMDPANLETTQNCLMAIIIPFIIPWKYVWKNYIMMPADRWR
jgi:hypothetical protein